MLFQNLTYPLLLILSPLQQLQRQTFLSSYKLFFTQFLQHLKDLTQLL